VIDGELWDRPDDDFAHAKGRSRLYNTSTLVTLTTGVLICYLALRREPGVGAVRPRPRCDGGLPALVAGLPRPVRAVWFVASAATVGGALGTGLESDEAVRAAAYSQREEERRDRLARERT
jgi:hypothetical protein